MVEVVDATLCAIFVELVCQIGERRVKLNEVHVAERTLKRDLARLRDADVIGMQGTRKGATYALHPRKDQDPRPG